MVDPTVQENIRKVLLVMEVAVGWMENGVTGHLGQFVEVTARGKDTESVTILLLKMEDMIVKETTRKKVFVLEEDVLLMEGGEIGHLGQLVEVIVRSQDIEDATIHLLKMEDMIVKETTGKKVFVLEEDVLLMEGGEIGHLGQAVEAIVRSQDIEDVKIPLLQMED